MISLLLNENEVSTALPAGTTLLDFIRYHQHLTGTKIGCREGDCGACTVLVGDIKDGRLQYTSATSCLMAIGNASNKHIVTIEGINHPDKLNFIQEAFSKEGATQCGFCTPGFIVSLAGHCMSGKKSCYENTIDAVNGNICRCTGYKSIERAVKTINEALEKRNGDDALSFAVQQKMIPGYFLKIEERLLRLKNKHVVIFNESGRFLGGGTDLYVQQHEAMVHEKIDFLFNKPGLNTIIQKENICELGAAVTVSDIADSPVFKNHFPNLHHYIKLVSSTQIRNMATIAGNFTNASPIGDLTIFFLALDAQLHLTDRKSHRIVALRKFYKGYKLLDKTAEEWIEKISFKLPSPNDHFNFEKVCKRTWLDIASVNTAILLNVNNDQIISAGISAGGVGPVPAYLPLSSEWLAGKKLSAIHFSEFIKRVQSEISPISDVRGTEAYKRLLLSQLIKAHFIVLFPVLQQQLIRTI